VHFMTRLRRTKEVVVYDCPMWTCLNREFSSDCRPVWTYFVESSVLTVVKCGRVFVESSVLTVVQCGRVLT
jgi:hypothetical protein